MSGNTQHPWLAGPEHCLSPLGKRSEKTNSPGTRRHATSMCVTSFGANWKDSYLWLSTTAAVIILVARHLR
ncbi:hypothetical protein HanRHA438_Chr17g0817221 [Helianthus annuus]|nr:hypothetical protein HanRHA438_Chr17g0817221 [Helianthus annuus]